MTWRIVLDRAHDGAWNMACDDALRESASSAGSCTLRLYAWSPPALSFGRNEPALRRYDREAIAARGLAAVRRPTGGRAVWHDHEVTYSVTAPLHTFGSLRETYREIHTLIAAALASLGAPVSVAPDRPPAPLGAGSCFASTAGGEIVTPTGLKVVGSAQMRAGDAFLQHGSVLLAAEQNVLHGLTRGRTARPAAAGMRDLVAPDRSTWSAVASAIAREAERRWGASRCDLPPGVLERTEALALLYADPTWTWRR